MKPFAAYLALPVSLVLLISQVSAEAAPTAIRKLAPNANEKILAEHLAFAPLSNLFPRGDDDVFFVERDEAVNGSTRFLPAYARHFSDADYTLLRRAAEALTLLQRRDSCPSGTNSCSSVDHPNKCCQEGTYCVLVDDDSVGGVACCSDGSSCGGDVASCPSGATSCSEDLGGGCCVAGYVCEGVGCVPSASATRTSTSTKTSTSKSTTSVKTTAAPTTSTEAETTSTETSSQEASRTTATSNGATATETGSGTATGGAPLRPTLSETTTTDSTQTGCPTGYYGCLATHGGGCCRTDRDCNTYDCPASSLTVASDGATVVVVGTDAPPVSSATSTCAGGWFLCGTAAGSVAGCCPTGYSCGTASCFTATASHTESVQKQFPDAEDIAPARSVPRMALGGLAVMACLLTAL